MFALGYVWPVLPQIKQPMVWAEIWSLGEGIHYIFFIHSSVDRLSGYFHSSIVISNAAPKIGA